MNDKTFITWRRLDRHFIAIDRGDGWHIIDDTGANYGAWFRVETFRKHQASGSIQADALPGCRARPQVRVFNPATTVEP